MKTESRALGPIKDIFWALAFAAIVTGAGRFAFGLGAATNMMDSLPWGWWKVFNMVAGAALATSGFIVASIIYNFKMERFRPVARISVLIGFLGYGSSLGALIFDIGLPHRGWHPFFMWNPHSFLFEVFWCVSVYWGITALELVPILTERFPLKKFTHWMHEKMLPFVVLGITLSTMHHSSLGSLFMMSPTRLHPLWHNMWIPPTFFISAMGAGLSVIVLITIVTNRLYNRPNDWGVLRGLARGSAALLGVFLVLRLLELTINDKWSFVFGPEATWESQVFLVEILLQAIVPIAVLGVGRFRRSTFGLVVGTTSAFLGIVMHRIDTGIVGYFRSSEAVYIPNLSEFVLSFGILSAAGLVFFFLLERFHVIDDAGLHGDAPGHEAPTDIWTKQEANAVFFGPGAWRAARIFVVAVPIAWMVLSEQATGRYQPIPEPISSAVLASDEMRTMLYLDGNRNGMVTHFNHVKHQQEFQKIYEIPEKETCVKCHHLNLPNDKNTSCRRCHQDMRLETPMFEMARHEERFKKDEDRAKFLAADLGDRLETYEACMECHKDNMEGLASYAREGFSFQAPGYKYAMHGSCLECHRLRERELNEDPSYPMSRGNCLYCHRDWADEEMRDELAAIDQGTRELPKLPLPPGVAGVAAGNVD